MDIAATADMPDSASLDNSARRDRSIRLAVVTSLVSKFGTLLLQLVSIPLAVRVLGREEFGLFTMVNLTLSSISLLEIGVGPALTHGLSKARAQGDEDGQRKLVTTAFLLMIGMALLVGAIAALILAITPVSALFGSKFVGKEEILRPALWVGLGLFLMFFVVNLTERIREGYLEVASNNLWGAVGNVLGAIAVGIGIWYVPEVWFLVIAVQGSMILAKLGNTFSVWRKHPVTIPRWRAFQPKMIPALLTDGLSFSACFILTGFVEANFCGWLIGQLGGGPSSVALWGVFVTLTVMQLGFVVMLSTPTWPAVSEALARGDITWARSAARRLYTYGLGFALLSSTGLVILGPWGLGLWLGKSFSDTDHVVLACYAAYFIAHVWRHLNHAMMIGTGQVKRLAVIQTLETGFMAAVVSISLYFGGLNVMLLAMAATIFCGTGWILPRLVHRALKHGN